MDTKYVNFCRCFVILVLLQTFMPPGAESKPLPGKKANMALSALAGMTAGHLIGRAVAARREKKEKLDMSEHLPPNCRREVRTERDKEDWNKFIETKYIVCDPLPNQPQQPQQQQIQIVQPSAVVPAQPAAPAVQPAVVPQPSQEQPAGYQQPALTGPPIGFVQPPQQAGQPSAQAPQIVQSPQPVPPVQTVQMPQGGQTGPQPMQPVQVVQQAQPAQPAQGPSQVFVMSKKTGYFKKNSADKLLQTNLVLMMMMAFLLIWFQ
ncbi:cell division protein ZipA-like [Bactrocera tryoni]|uniref:cell division protein ZipA-like n=1 Tax=Bactrocera tryoni TaxID=59916 RepID=UPI001A98AEB0|nr:cell division protein ZipA-like [Bactrocera tryoni]